MSIHIDSSEVLHHLNSYGIHSIDDEALKSFIKDLKKLIKYEQYKYYHETRTQSKNTVCPKTLVDSGKTIFPAENMVIEDFNRDTAEKENIDPVFFESKCKKKIRHENHAKYDCSNKNILSKSYHQNCDATFPITGKNICKCGALISPKQNKNNDKEKKDFLVNRPISSMSGSRSHINSVKPKKGHCDPVELYQYYQSIWKNHKLPGENDHAQLRQAIRKKLMNVN